MRTKNFNGKQTIHHLPVMGRGKYAKEQTNRGTRAAKPLPTAITGRRVSGNLLLTTY
jgi:hypothetical protein